jgi:acid phosphatase
MNMLNRREVLSGFAASAAMTMLPKAIGAHPTETLDFLVVGDWGRDGSDHQREVAAQMGRTAKSRGSHHVISVGDNFYDDGVQSV